MTKLKKVFIIGSVLILSIVFVAEAQHFNAPPGEGKQDTGTHFVSALESNLSMLVLLFGIVTIFLEVYLIKVNKIDPNNTIKFIIVTLIITGTLFLITAGYDAQISPALGLLGTIAGYLLGKTETTNPTTTP